MTIWVAKGDSVHFVFEAYGATRDKALAAYERLIHAHLKQYPGADATWAQEMIDDASVAAVEIDAGYRDGERVV